MKGAATIQRKVFMRETTTKQSTVFMKETTTKQSTVFMKETTTIQRTAQRAAVILMTLSMAVSMCGCGMFSIIKNTGETVKNIGDVIEDNKDAIQEQFMEKAEEHLEDRFRQITGEDLADQLQQITGEDLADQLQQITGEDLLPGNSSDYFLRYWIKETTDVTYADDNETPIKKVLYQQVGLVDSEGNSAPNLSKALDEFNQRQVASISEDSSYAEGDVFSDNPSMYYDYERTYVINRSDRDIFSLTSTYASFTGGAHPNSSYGCYNFDTATGREIGSNEVFYNPEALCDYMADSLLKNYDYNSFFSIDPSLETPKTKQLSKSLYENYFSSNDAYVLNFSIGYDGIDIIFSPYDICAYAAGLQQVFIPFSDCAAFVKEKYIIPASSYITEFNTQNYYIYLYSDLKNNGTLNRMDVKMNPVLSEESSTDMNYEDITVVIDDNEYTLKASADDYRAYFLNDNSDKYIFVQTLVDDSGSMVYGFKVNDGDFVSLGKAFATIDGMFDPNGINWEN